MKYIASLLMIMIISGCSVEVGNKKYTEESYHLKDGTPCTIIKGGTHSGMVGITCNYHN